MKTKLLILAVIIVSFVGCRNITDIEGPRPKTCKHILKMGIDGPDRISVVYEENSKEWALDYLSKEDIKQQFGITIEN